MFDDSDRGRRLEEPFRKFTYCGGQTQNDAPDHDAWKASRFSVGVRKKGSFARHSNTVHSTLADLVEA
jgi:hypothetical protein